MPKAIPSWTYEYDLKQNRSIYLKIINQVFDSGRLLFGEQLEKFEIEFSEYIGTKYGIGCDNATNGLFLSLKVLGVGNNDMVVTVPNTAIPTVSAIRQAGAIPIFVDVNEYGLIDINKLEKLLEHNSKNIKVIMPVHLYGFPCDMEKINLLAKNYNLRIIEDCSQSHGTVLNKKKAGSYGDLSVFSFYPTKSLGGYGDAGMICTNIEEYKIKLKKLRFYGIQSNYSADIDGYNSRMDEIHAGILRYKLKNLDNNISYRQSVVDIYKENIISDIMKILQPPKCQIISNYLVPFIFKGNRDNFQKQLLSDGLSTNVSYRYPIHLMPAYEDLGYKTNDFPQAEFLCKKNISLPIFDYIPLDLVHNVVEIINRNLRNIDS